MATAWKYSYGIVHSFLYLFSKYTSNDFYVPGIRDAMMNKRYVAELMGLEPGKIS